MENYKVIKDYPNYGISKDGEVVSLGYNRKLKPVKNTTGYMRVDLTKHLVSLYSQSEWEQVCISKEL